MLVYSSGSEEAWVLTLYTYKICLGLGEMFSFLILSTNVYGGGVGMKGFSLSEKVWELAAEPTVFNNSLECIPGYHLYLQLSELGLEKKVRMLENSSQFGILSQF